MGHYYWPLWEVEELVGCILQWLPLSTLMLARFVCKTWNRVVLLQRSKITLPCCYRIHNGVVDDYEEKCCPIVHGLDGQLFDPSVSSWTRVSAPPLQPNSIGYVLPSTGAAGLIAVCERQKRDTRDDPTVVLRFWVGNPLTNKWKCVPVCPRFAAAHSMSFLQFVIESEGPPVSYKIVAIASRRRDSEEVQRAPKSLVEVVTYSSSTQKWALGAATACLLLRASSVLHNGCIYFVTIGYDRVRGYPTGLVSYNLEHDRFDEVVFSGDMHHNASTLDIDILPVGREDNQPPPVYTVVEVPRNPPLDRYQIIQSLFRRVNDDPPPERTVQFCDFEPTQEGWALKATSRFDVLKEGLPRFCYYGLDFLGDAQQMYAAVSAWNRLGPDIPSGLYQFDRSASRFVRRPCNVKCQGVEHELDYCEKFPLTYRMCSFIPRFDIHPF